MRDKRIDKRKYFAGIFMRYFLPAVLSIFLVGGVGMLVGYHYLKTELGNANQKLLNTTLQNTEMMLSELDSLMLAFDINPAIINKCYHVLNAEVYGYQEHQDLEMIETYIDAPVNARQYIDSIYIYYPNEKKRYIKSNDRVSILGGELNESWYGSYLKYKDSREIFSERRKTEEGRDVVSVYQIVDHDGVVILNLDVQYLIKMMKDTEVFEGQTVEILNQDEEVLLSTNSETLSKDKHVVYRRESDRYLWTYISVVPREEFYRLSFMILEYAGAVLVIAVATALAFATISTVNNYRKFHRLQEILEAAKNGKEYKIQSTKRNTDYFAYITELMLQNFIEQNYLKVQLSERKYRLRTMELLAMQSQMNPHFLYNTLETINWKVAEAAGGRSSANEMVENLSEILAYSLDQKHEFAPMKEEIRVTKCYIQILKERYGGIFELEWNYNDDILAIKIVKFILQPLIENAVNHGIRESGRQDGRIKITIRKKEKKIVIRVTDNGAGIKKEKLQELREGLNRGDSFADHIGVYNTNKRVKLAYGENYGIQIYSKVGVGTITSVMLPVSFYEEESQKMIQI